MSQNELVAKYPDPHHDTYSKAVFGFWVYIMTDCILFSVLFATYAVLHNSTFGGATSKDIYDLNYALIETLLLLTSSFTAGIVMLKAYKKEKSQTLVWLFITFLLGLAFVVMEVHEFRQLYLEGHSWTKSAFLSSFFTLVGTHGFHVSMGLLWMVVLGFQLFFKGITNHTFRRLTCFSYFWHFLDIVWIFIFTIVYLMGVI
jgi:cytochrome o ubiquinol oxidase subunit 3